MCTSKCGSYASGSLVAGRVTHAGPVLSEVPYKEKYKERPWPSSLGVEHNKISSPHISPDVSKPQQQGGCGLKISQSAIEKEEEQEDEEEENVLHLEFFLKNSAFCKKFF